MNRRQAGPNSGIKRRLPEEVMFFGFNEATPSFQEGGRGTGKDSGYPRQWFCIGKAGKERKGWVLKK